MFSAEQLQKWLAEKNEIFRANDIHPKRRPFLALMDLSKEFGTAIDLQSNLSNQVFDWFTANTKHGSHTIGSMFTGVYYFDACFWPVSIPVGAGTFLLNALDSLQTMPKGMKAQLKQDTDELWHYAFYWVDCLDFAYGTSDLREHSGLPGLAQSFLQNGEREIETTIAQISSSRPNAKAILTGRMAVEIYLKCLLIARGGWDEPRVKALGHNIEKTIDECIALSLATEFTILRPMLAIYPPVAARYTGIEEPVRKIWEAYCIAQATATLVIRILSGRDSRSQIGKKQ